MIQKIIGNSCKTLGILVRKKRFYYTLDEINNLFISYVQDTESKTEKFSFHEEHTIPNAGNFEFRMAT